MDRYQFVPGQYGFGATSNQYRDLVYVSNPLGVGFPGYSEFYKSSDGGQTFPYRRHVKDGPGDFAYPYAEQTKDGRIGASASGKSGTPGNAGTAPSPSQTGLCTQ